MALRPRAGEEPGGEVIALISDVPADEQPGFISVRADITVLGGDVGTTYDVVLVPAAGRRATPVWSPPLTLPAPPPAPDGRTRFALQRGPEGFLQLRSRPLPVAAVLTAVRADQERVVLSIDPGATPATTLALLGEDDTDRVLATCSLSDAGEAHVDVGLADDLEPQLTRVVVGEPDAWLPVRRSRNDLVDTARGAPLPQLTDPASGELALRLRWSGQGTLTLRVLE